jgi:hypothetical protein
MRSVGSEIVDDDALPRNGVVELGIGAESFDAGLHGEIARRVARARNVGEANLDHLDR